MIRLIGAELLKLRRRWATYLVPAIGIVLMGLIYLLVGGLSRGSSSSGGELITRFPSAYSFINQFVFGLGSLMAVAYAAAIGGADWSWGIMRVVIARGEGRGRYVLAKAIGLAVVLFIGTMVALAFGILFAFVGSALAGRSAGSVFSNDSVATLGRSVFYGMVVLLERASIGFAVAFVLRSQLAGVVVGIVLQIAESILSAILLVVTFSSQFGANGPRGGDFTGSLGTQWYQFLPFSIGNSLLTYATPTSSQDLSSVVLTPVPLPQALAGTLIYLLLAVGIATFVTVRAEIRS